MVIEVVSGGGEKERLRPTQFVHLHQHVTFYIQISILELHKNFKDRRTLGFSQKCDM